MHACAQHSRLSVSRRRQLDTRRRQQTLSVNKPENPRIDDELMNLSGRDHLFRRRGGPLMAPSQEPTSAHCTLACLAYSVLLKRRGHLLLLLFAIPLDISSPFCPCVGRVCLENASCIIPHANLSHVLTPSGYHVMPFLLAHAAQPRAKALGARQDSAACPRYASCRLRRGSSAAEREER